MSNFMDRRLADIVRNFEGSLSKATQAMESHFDNQIKTKEIKGIGHHHHHSSHTECKEGRDKI